MCLTVPEWIVPKFKGVAEQFSWPQKHHFWCLKLVAKHQTCKLTAWLALHHLVNVKDFKRSFWVPASLEGQREMYTFYHSQWKSGKVMESQGTWNYFQVWSGKIGIIFWHLRLSKSYWVLHWFTAIIQYFWRPNRCPPANYFFDIFPPRRFLFQPFGLGESFQTRQTFWNNILMLIFLRSRKRNKPSLLCFVL